MWKNICSSFVTGLFLFSGSSFADRNYNDLDDSSRHELLMRLWRTPVSKLDDEGACFLNQAISCSEINADGVSGPEYVRNVSQRCGKAPRRIQNRYPGCPD